jgi:leader peptidase (prepilin peptidase)/N-methyltransferase
MLALTWLYPALAAPFIGSFVGVLVTRLPRGRSVVWGRSECPGCGHELGPSDLVPIASWLLSRGRCRYCTEPVSRLYPMLELAAFGLAVWAATAAGTTLLLWVSCGLAWLLLALAAIDIRDGLLPDALTLPLIPAGLATAYLIDPDEVLSHAIGAAAGLIAFVTVRLIYRRWRGREGLGLGDAKLLAAAGAWVSWTGLPSVVLIAAIAGLVSKLALRSPGDRLALDSEIAFGPGLCIGLWLVWLYGPLG